MIVPAMGSAVVGAGFVAFIIIVIIYINNFMNNFVTNYSDHN